jgi:hypothetical protein
MKTININLTHLLSSGNLKLDRLSFFRQLSDKLTKDNYNGITFTCIKYTNELINLSYNSSKLSFNKGFANYKGVQYKLNNKDVALLTYIKSNQKQVVRQKKDYYIFTNVLKTYLFNARVNGFRYMLHCFVKEDLQNYHNKGGCIRVYFLKDLAFFADKVRCDINIGVL